VWAAPERRRLQSRAPSRLSIRSRAFGGESCGDYLDPNHPFRLKLGREAQS